MAAPPKILEGHVQDTKGDIRGRYRQTKSNMLRTYADSGQIDEAMLEAAEWYEERFLAVFATGRDSTDMDSVSGSAGSRTPLSQYQAESLREIIAVDSRLTAENRQIVRGICGEGKGASECVREVTGEESRHFPIPRFREALTRLVSAIVRARKQHWTVCMSLNGVHS